MDRKVTVFTYVDRYSFFLYKWIEYYTSIFKQEELVIIYSAVTEFDITQFLKNKNLEKIDVIHVNSSTDSFIQKDKTFNDVQSLLLKTNDVVIYSDVDEIIFHPKLRNLINTFDSDYLTTKGFEVVHYKKRENDLNFSKKIMNQRTFGILSDWYDKPLILRKELCWETGKHNKSSPKIFHENLYLVHLNKVDFNLLNELNKQNNEIFKNVLNHNSLTDKALSEHFESNLYNQIISIPKIIRNNLSI